MPRGTAIGRGWRLQRNLWMLVFPEELEGKQGVGHEPGGPAALPDPSFPFLCGSIQGAEAQPEISLLGSNFTLTSLCDPG